LVIAGSQRQASGVFNCGVFEILLPAGTLRQVLTSDCRYQWSWDQLSLSPDGKRAVATVGSNATQNLHIEVIDLASGTAKTLSIEFWAGVWSPDGKWIAALGNHSRSLVLIDANNFSKRKNLGTAAAIRPAWSPDSRYLVLWKFSLFRCGFFLDIEPPATAEALDVNSGKRTTIRSSACQLNVGQLGWLSRKALPQ